EVTRSAFQFRMFADVVREGGFLEAMIDHAASTPLGDAPDVRRLLVPIGPVAVFGSSNFPFAFSVLGGDTASALASGSPLVVKAHGSHPLTSALSFEVLAAAAVERGAPDGTVGIVYGQQAGTRLVAEQAIAAVGFTGSLATAFALRAVIEQRQDPIPFYGELSSINPLIVTAKAAAARGRAIAQGLFASFTGSGGQLCTKPGIAFVPEGEAGQAIVDELARLTDAAGAEVLLNARIRDAFREISDRLAGAGGAQLARGAEDDQAEADIRAGYTVAPTVLQANASALGVDLAEECFGPLIVVARYGSLEEVIDALGRIPASLTVTLHSEGDDRLDDILPTLDARAGRIVFNGFPTGVRVSWAQHHGGPWPATNTQHTSVGATAIRRFLRPVAWQNAPAAALPEELRDDFTAIPRRVDGVLVPAAIGARP
ncbi:MAG: aldehyde dehydrogenase, partial [Frankiales bacterium]|nr:aldehyde dehydrogenase [Frankiales bacterium]